MGAQQSDATEVQTQQQYQMFLLQYSKEREHNHSQFGAVKLYNHNQTNQLIFIKKYYTKSESELNTLNNHLRKRKIFTQPNLFQLLAVRTCNEQAMCSDSSSVMVVSECYLDNLEKELLKKKRYSEQHAWLLIQQIVDPCAFLESQLQVHGDIRPANIFLDENGSVKLVEYNYLPEGQPGFQKMLLSKDKCYLSPTLLQAYRNMNFQPTHNQYKSDVYSFGLTLLEVLLNEESYDCMDFQTGCIKQSSIDAKIQKIKRSGYSQLLTNFVKELLQYQEEDRPNWNDLKQVIDQFRDKIYNLVPLQPQLQQSVYQPLLQSPVKVAYQPAIYSSPRSTMYQSIPVQSIHPIQSPSYSRPFTVQQQPQIPMQQSIYYEGDKSKQFEGDKSKHVGIKKITKLEDTTQDNSQDQTAIKQQSATK